MRLVRRQATAADTPHVTSICLHVQARDYTYKKAQSLHDVPAASSVSCLEFWGVSTLLTTLNIVETC